jgi:hypothetical protein
MCKDCKWECIEVGVEDFDRAIKELEDEMKKKGARGEERC